MNRNSICVVRIPKRDKKEEGIESILKAIVAEDFLNLGREVNIQIHEAQRIPNRFNPNRAILKQVLIKLSKIKDKKEF